MTNLEKVYDRVYVSINQEVPTNQRVTKATVEDVFKSQFAFVKKIMEEGTDKPIRLERFGVFRVKPKRREYIDSKNKTKTETND
jgi:nucleoid DNA-binding protein